MFVYNANGDSKKCQHEAYLQLWIKHTSTDTCSFIDFIRPFKDELVYISIVNKLEVNWINCFWRQYIYYYILIWFFVINFNYSRMPMSQTNFKDLSAYKTVFVVVFFSDKPTVLIQPTHIYAEEKKHISYVCKL